MKTLHEFPKSVDVVVRTREELDRVLDEAVERLKPTALIERAGIEVARTGVGSYTASVKTHIPYGTSIQIWNVPNIETMQMTVHAGVIV